MEELVSDDADVSEITTLLERIAENPYDYDGHVAYITLLRKMGATDDLRQAREVFHSFFPFSEGLGALACSSLLID